MSIVYRDTRFMRSPTSVSLLTEVIVERLSQEGVSFPFRARLPVKLGENLINDAMRLHGAFDLFRPGVVALRSSLEVVIKLFELVDLILAEPDRRDCGRVGHAGRLAEEAIKDRDKR